MPKVSKFNLPLLDHRPEKSFKAYTSPPKNCMDTMAPIYTTKNSNPRTFATQMEADAMIPMSRVKSSCDAAMDFFRCILLMEINRSTRSKRHILTTLNMLKKPPLKSSLPDLPAAPSAISAMTSRHENSTRMKSKQLYPS